ncbi:MAG: hypothetical protein LQ351_001864 [Letrouitia transgressa]|nr:MAG: hypothetical protein LQ351_001864 [Letrouitia transgressa]
MTDSESLSSEDAHSYTLVTGANSGLGYAICCRLIDEFVHTRPNSHSLRLIITTRDKAKSHDTITKLRDYIFRKRKHHKASEKTPLVPKVYLQSEQVDLNYLPSVLSLSKKLLRSLPKLDSIILNAGYGGFTGIDWLNALWTIPTNFPQSVTYPTFKIGAVGLITQPQTPNQGTGATSPPQLGQVFCSNVFGHYLLTHALAPLFSNASHNPGRVIWLSSLEAFESSLSVSDIQGLRSPIAYESTKRLTDVLALTSSLPSTQPFVRRFLPSRSDHRPPKQYVAHPGICVTNILPLPEFILVFIVASVFYLARWLGSPWHTVTAYMGACAPVWLALSSQEELDATEDRKGAGKWGSSTNVWGEERVIRTEVEGWGMGGKVGDNRNSQRRARPLHVTELTEEKREEIEEVGRACWKEMERLREEWENILQEADGNQE